MEYNSGFGMRNGGLGRPVLAGRRPRKVLGHADKKAKYGLKAWSFSPGSRPPDGPGRRHSASKSNPQEVPRRHSGRIAQRRFRPFQERQGRRLHACARSLGNRRRHVIRALDGRLRLPVPAGPFDRRCDDCLTKCTAAVRLVMLEARVASLAVLDRPSRANARKESAASLWKM